MGRGSDKVLNRRPRLDYLKNKFDNGERIIASRYNDGEYLLMNGLFSRIRRGLLGEKTYPILQELLKKSILNKQQLVCTAYIALGIDVPDNHLWVKTQKYIVENSNHDLYGCSHWVTEDFKTGNILLPSLFSRETLIVSSLTEYLKPVLNNFNKNITYYNTDNLNVETQYEKIKSDLISISKNFKNIILGCSVLSKILLVDLIDECSANLVDVGSILNAICRKENEWSMSWVKHIDLHKCQNNFLSKVKQ